MRGVSHDLRNPLNTIRTVSSDLLDASIPHDESTRARDCSASSCDESDRLDRIVGNLLSVSQVQAGGLQPRLDAESVDDLIIAASAASSGSASTASGSTSHADLPDVSADAVQIDQVLTNLLENALRYAPTGTDVVVESRLVGRWSLRRGRGRRRTGPASRTDGDGERFRAVGRRRLGGHSTGLGLTVCKAIVERARRYDRRP